MRELDPEREPYEPLVYDDRRLFVGRVVIYCALAIAVIVGVHHLIGGM